MPSQVGGRLRRHVAVLMSATVLGQGLALAAAPALTRLYVPQDFGVLAAFGAVLGVAAGVACLCYEQAVPLPEDDADAADVAALAAVVLVGTSALAVVATWLFQARLAAAIGFPELGAWLWLLPATLLVTGLTQITTIWSIRQGAFPAIARAKVGKSVGQVGAQLGLGYAVAGPLGLVVGDLVGRICATAGLAAQAWRADRRVLTGVRPAGMRAAAVRFRRFPFPTGGAYLLKAGVVQVPTFVLLACYGPVVLGLYALAWRVIATPFIMLGEAVGQVYQGEASRLHRTEPERLRGLFATTALKLVAVGTPLVAATAVLGPACFGPIFGEDWREAGRYVQAMAPMFLVQFVANPLGFTLALFERHDLILVREVVFLVNLGGAVAIARYTNADGYGAVVLLSAASALSYLFYIAASWRALADAPRRAATPAPALPEERTA